MLDMSGKSFSELADLWYQNKILKPGADELGAAHRLKGAAPRTMKGYRYQIKNLKAHFQLPITEEMIRQFQIARADQAGPAKINKEVNLMRQILTDLRLWPNIEFKPLHDDGPEIPRALTGEEQEHFLKVAESSEEFLLMYCYTLVVLGGCESSYEIRELRIMDVTRGDNMVYIKRGKRTRRERTCPLGEKGPWAIQQLLKIAESKGAKKPHQYLFPKWDRRTQDWNPDEFTSDWGLVHHWEALRDAAGFPWFQCNALRHTAATRYAEAGVPIEVLLQYLGHTTEKMTRHYIQISQQATKAWAYHVASKKLPGSVPNSTAGMLITL